MHAAVHCKALTLTHTLTHTHTHTLTHTHIHTLAPTMALPAPPEGALMTPRFASFRHSMIPRPTSCTKKEAEDLSPKSVIVDRRFISPASSSSSSMDRRNPASNPGSNKCGQPRHDRGYSISDGEFSDPDSFLDSTGTNTSLELGKVGNSGPLESLPETHSLALEAGTNSNGAPAEEMSNARTSVNGLESSEPTTAVISIFVDRSSDSGRGEHGCSGSPHSSAGEIYQAAGRDTSFRGLQMPALLQQCHAVVEDRENGSSDRPSEWTSSQTSTSSTSSASEQDGKESDLSEISRRRDGHHQSSLSTSGHPLERGDVVDTSKRRTFPVMGQGAASSFGYPGTPLMRFSPSWSQPTPPSNHNNNNNSNPNNNNALPYSASPRVEKGFGSYSPASSTDVAVSLRFQHRFLSGPIMGSMIPKPPPSKWDDAEKWIVSPGHSDQSPAAQPHHRPLPTLSTGRRNYSIAGSQSVRSSFGADSPDYATPPGEKPMSPQFENAFINAGKLETPTIASPKLKRSKALSFGDLSRRFDPSRTAAAGNNNNKPAAAAQPQSDTLFREDDVDQSKAQTDFATTNDAGDHGSDDKSRDPSRTPSKHARSVSMKEISAVPVVPVAPVCVPEPTLCRDMGTQMTPAESLRNSTCTTPGLATSPTRHNTPARSGRRAASLGAFPGAVEALELQSCHLAKLELRRLAGDGQPTLDRNSVWTTREEEEMESAASLRGDSGDFRRGKRAATASAWEEAEQAKALVRYKNKEAKIKGWEELQKIQAEAEMKKIEAKAEKILADASEKMKGRMAVAANKAAEMRAAAEVVRKEQAAKAAERVELIRQTGLVSPARPSFTSCFLV